MSGYRIIRRSSLPPSPATSASTASRQAGIDRLYEFLVNEEDARVCKAISDQACREVPGNFLRILLSRFSSKLADTLLSARIVLPWVLTSVGAPAFFSGLLVPIRESVSLLPQLLVGGVIRAWPVRKWFYSGGCLLQAMSALLMVVIAVSLQGSSAGWAICAALLLFSLGRGICSVASKDVIGKTVPKTRRGRLEGYSASGAGIIALAVGLVLIADTGQQIDLVWILSLGALCWLLTALAFASVSEYPGATEGGGNAIREALRSTRVLHQDAEFRRFVICRCLLFGSSLAAPYLVLIARERSGDDSSLLHLGVFICVAGVGDFISGGFWGRLADYSSRRLMQGTAIASAAICCCAALLSQWSPAQGPWLMMVLFLVLGMTHQGVRLGRKTYILDLADGNKRTDYVAVGNTVTGVLLILAGIVTAMLAQWSLVAVLLAFAVAALLAAWLCRGLPEV